MIVMSADRIEKIKKNLAPLRRQIVEHCLFRSIESVEDVAFFMEHHVFAVWDFMTLLKTLQIRLTCVETPWVPIGDPLNRRLINEIVLGEESDEHPEGGYTSHFELYCEAMHRCGSDTQCIQEWVRQAGSKSLDLIAHSSALPGPTRPFVLATLESSQGPTHQVAAAFTFGREELIPDLFRNIIKGLAQRFPDRVGLFQKYLERHVDIDEGRHTPLSLQMLASLCGNDDSKWQQAYEEAERALIKRKEFWDAILLALQSLKAQKSICS